MSDLGSLNPQATAAAKAEKAKRNKIAREDEVADLKQLMGQKWGRRIVWRLLDKAGVLRLSYRSNAMDMSFAEGNRNYGLWLFSEIHAHCLDRYVEMLKEHSTDGRGVAGSRTIQS